MFGSFGEVARYIFTALCVNFMVGLKKGAASTRGFLDISKLLENAPNRRAKVRVRLKLECGLI